VLDYHFYFHCGFYQLNFSINLVYLSHGLHNAFRFKEKNYGSSGASSGLTSSLAFTPVQVCTTFYPFHGLSVMCISF
jgi:hypothetical protein